MKEISININTVDKVKEFINDVTKYDVDLDVISPGRRYIVDAKSIMGIFSLDISRDLILRIHADGERAEEIADGLRKYHA